MEGNKDNLLSRSQYILHIFLSGRAPQRLSLDMLASQGYSSTTPLPVKHAHTVLVPGAAAGWVDTVQEMGSGKVRVFVTTVPANVIALHSCPCWIFSNLLSLSLKKDFQ